MNLSQHPEYEKYLSDKASTHIIQTQLTQWLEENEEDGAAFITAVSQLTNLFLAYNKVIWQTFPFCHMCRGGCCVVDASKVAPIDAAALSILGFDLPTLPDQTHHDKRACIYLGEAGCTWPTNWRPLKCMIFYSLGSGDWQLESADTRYGRLSKALQAVLDEHLPTILDKNNQIDTDELAEPIGFAASLALQLAKQFLPTIIWRKDDPSPVPSPDPTMSALLAIAEIAGQILLNPPAMADQLLVDLAQFEWVVTGRPSRENELLAEINGRYAPHIHEHPTYLHFTQHIQQFTKNRENIHL